MRSQSGERENRVGSYGDVVKHGRLPKTLAESNATVLIRNLSV